jgi:hypothetical protein
MKDAKLYVFRLLGRLPNKAKRPSRSNRATERVFDLTRGIWQLLENNDNFVLIAY